MSDDPPKMLTPVEVHTALQVVFEALFGLMYRLGDGFSSDTAAAIGYATGTISNAKALVGRDIDNAKQCDVSASASRPP